MNTLQDSPFLNNHEQDVESVLAEITCVADVNITGQLDRTLADLALPEVFVQRAKQIALDDKPGFLGLRRVARLDESRALVYRFYIPAVYAQGAMRRIAEAADLRMGGRGCILAQYIDLFRGAPLAFDREKLQRLCGKVDKVPPEDYALICCTVPRGLGDTLASAVLELGVCVPVVFFGTGVGLRDRLGLLRITIPVEKEIIWFLVPRADAELVEKTLIPRARLDVPGHGFLYKTLVHAPVINLQVRMSKRVHAASMEQVIAALDEVSGSSDWRRLGTRRGEAAGDGEDGDDGFKGLFFIGEEEEVEEFRRTAMENGAHGATLNDLEMRSYSDLIQGQVMESHSRQLCDIIIPSATEKKLLEPIIKTGLFDSDKTCVLKSFNVEMPLSFRRQG
ncbi:MAG: hypothetical protein LBD48_05040 [Treponema sp.]|jgi:hypothetical protein|nr:hypothetical protein [Treponema sp.]